MISLLNRNNGMLELDMAMGPRDFVQSRLLPFLEEDGWLVCGTNLSSWKFTEVVQRGDSICVTGSDFPGTSLLELLCSENTSEKKFDTSIISILKEVFRGMELILQQKPDFQFFGPAQILVERDASKVKLLFLPPTLFKRAIESRPSQEQGQLSGCYCNPQLQGAEAVAFTQGVYLYQGLSGQLPFSQLEEGQRMEDYRDKNFIPLEFLVPDISSQVAASVNNNLQLGNSVTTKNKFKLQQIIKDKTGEAPPTRESVLLHSMVVAEEANLLELSQKAESTEFIQRRESYQQQQEKELHRKRFIKKYSTWIKVALAVVAVGIAACISGIKDWRNEFVSTGLNPAQVCGVLYTALDEQNLVMAKAMCTGSGTEEFQERLSNFFIANRMRTGMNPMSLALTPSQWIQYLYQQEELAQQATQESSSPFQQREIWIYGVTNFHLEMPQLPEKSSSQLPVQASSRLPVYPPLRKDKLQPVDASAGEKLQAVATYSLVYSDGLEQLQLEHHRDSLTLEYKKQSWQVVSVEQDFYNEMVEQSQIQGDFIQLLKDFQQENAEGQVLQENLTNQLLQENATNQLLQENAENRLLQENVTKQLLQAYPWLGSL
ncbi:MAG: hypothetical protein SO369_02280 [Treponema sp.]|nr:hypothetical protein [Treponema sp.]